MVNNHSSGGGDWVRIPAGVNFYQLFNFSMNDLSKYQNTVAFYSQIDKQEEIFNNF